MRLFCFGLGYSAEELAQNLVRERWQVRGTVRTADAAERLRSKGYDSFVFDGERASAEVARSLRTATHVLISVPPDAAGDPVLRWHSDDLAQAQELQWIGYLSTVGVYGDHGGAWVDEETTPVPLTARSQHRMAAERAWMAIGEAQGRRVQVFRLAGIYGPGRSVIQDLARGRARRIVKPGQVFNRIHVADIASVLRAAMAGLGSQALYNVTDDEPADSESVLLYAAGLLGIAPPPAISFAEAQLSPMAASFYNECKRVSNGRIKADLGIALLYPSYREGLRAIAAGPS